MTTSMGSFKCWIFIKNLHKLYIWPIYVFHSQLNIPVDAGVSLHGRFMIRYRVQFLLLPTYRLPMFSLKCMCTSCMCTSSMFSIHSTRHMPSAISTVHCKILVQCLFPNYGNYIKKITISFLFRQDMQYQTWLQQKRWYGGTGWSDKRCALIYGPVTGIRIWHSSRGNRIGQWVSCS